MKPTFFESPAAFREWLEKNHDKASELLVGFYKRDSGRPSITWPESVDQALCFGWIDGVRRRIDDVSYSIRFTPRKRGSNWSAINIGRATELTKLGLMRPAGTLSRADEKRFRSNKKAWKYFNDQPPSYSRVAIYWVMSAKKEETRARRLATLIDDSAHGRRLGAVTLKPRRG